MSTGSPMLAAMGLNVRAVERKRDFDEAVLNLKRAREEVERLERARLKPAEELSPR